MSQENVEIVKRVYEVLAQGVDEHALRSLVAAGLASPDAELDLSTAYPDGPVVRMATLSEFFASLPWGNSTRFEPESFRAVGSDRVLVFIRAHGTGTGSGVEVEARGAHLITMRDGRVVRTESYTDRAKALAAAGLPE
jgi:ketosteroid isomerase-like protein